MNDIQFVGEHTTTFEVREHTHDTWEFIYCTHGEGCFTFSDGTRICYSKGDAVVIPPMLGHSNTTSSEFSNLYVQISEPAFSFTEPFCVSDCPEKYLHLGFQQAKFHYLSDIPNYEKVLSALGDLIVNYITVYRSSMEYSEPVRQIRSKIMLCYSDCDFALDAYIKTLPFHYDYLRKLYKREIGLTPLEYMTQLRMKRACILLTMKESPTYSITEIAQLCGYEDALYFSRVFKKTYGISPSAFAGR